MKKTIALIVAMFLVLTLVGCSSAPQVSTGNPSVSQNENSNEQAENASKFVATAESDIPAYYFISNIFLGSCDVDGWHSLCDTAGGYGEDDIGDATVFYTKDLLAVLKYSLYDDGEYVGDADRIVWLTEEEHGLGTFEIDGTAEKFSKYGELYKGSDYKFEAHRIFNLPVKLGNELAELVIPDYNFCSYFILENHETVYDSSSGLLATNSNAEISPCVLSHNEEVTPKGMQTLNDLFKEAGMENTIPNFTDCIRGDFDADGKDEYVIIANSPVDDLHWPAIAGEGERDMVGTFSAILYQEDDGKVQVLHNDMRPMKETVTFSNGQYSVLDIEHCHNVTLESAGDLNGDGIYEIAARIGVWESGYTLMFSQNENGIYEVVLRANWGL